MIPKLTPLGKIVFGVIAAIILALVLVSAWNAIRAKPKAEAKLANNQVEAVQESGKDATNTIANAGGREAASEDLTRTNSEEIHNAEGADQSVTAAARDAGLASLCRRASYQQHPKCLQRTHP